MEAGGLPVDGDLNERGILPTLGTAPQMAKTGLGRLATEGGAGLIGGRSRAMDWTFGGC